jgi:hypothetical protein
MATYNKFQSFVEELANGNHNLASDQLVVALTAEENAPVATNTILGNLIEIDYANCSSRNITIVSSSRTNGIYKLVLQDLTLIASGAVGPFRYVVIYNDDSPADKLINWYDYGSEITLASGETFKVDFDDSAGVLQIA